MADRKHVIKTANMSEEMISKQLAMLVMLLTNFQRKINKLGILNDNLINSLIQLGIVLLEGILVLL